MLFMQWLKKKLIILADFKQLDKIKMKLNHKNKNKKVPYYEITHKGKKIIVGCAVGHLFGLKEKNGKG